MKSQLILFFLLHTSLVFGQQNQSINFLIVKYGDESATQVLASEFLESYSDYFKQHFKYLKNRPVHGWIANNQDSAKYILNKRKPDFAFVPPGFYLEFLYESRETAHPILQVPRFEKSKERYYLVSSKIGPNTLKELKNQNVATVFSIDRKYLKRVVFPPRYQPDDHFQMKPSENLADELFLMLEETNSRFNAGEMRIPSALLFDEELKKFFQDDQFVWPELKIIWTSEPLPRDLVVTMGPLWTDTIRAEFKQVLLNMKNDQPGNDILGTMQSSGFSEIDQGLLDTIIKKYFAYPKSK